MTNRTRTPNISGNGSSCCSGKVVSYSCKVRCMILFCFLLLATALAVIYFLLVKSTGLLQDIKALPKMVDWNPKCPSTLLQPSERFDCYPEDSFVSSAACEARGCCYLGLLSAEGRNDTWEDNVPICVYPSNYGYEATNKAEVTLDGFEIPLTRIPAPSRYGDDIQNVNMKVEMQTKNRLRIKVSVIPVDKYLSEWQNGYQQFQQIPADICFEHFIPCLP